MSIYLTGDTHCPLDVEKLNTKLFPAQKGMTREDFVIVLGDFGLLWHEDREYRWWKRWFEEKPFTLLWLDGNHENHDWIDSLPVSEWCGGKVHKISDNIIHLMRGQVFRIDDKDFFVFGGAASHDKEIRREGISWWSREEASWAEQNEGLDNLAKHGNSVDYILTHTCPDSLIRPMFGATPYPTPTGNYLDCIAETLNRYTRWFFGHWHTEKDYGKYSAMYNSVRNVDSWDHLDKKEGEQ